MVKILRKVIKLGGSSKVITLPKEIAEKVRTGDDILIDIQLVDIIETNKTKSYRCRGCSYQFDSDDEIPYCPACDCEDIEEINFEDEEEVQE